LARGQSRSAFVESLDRRIRDGLSLSESGLDELTYPSKKCLQALLLMNVETNRRMADPAERYSFRAHASREWSLEHIHAQSAQTLTTVDQWAEWLKLHLVALQEMPNVDEDLRARLTDEINSALANRQHITGQIFQRLAEKLVASFAPTNDGTQEDDIQSISNLALLDAPTNSALGNSVFEVKRRHVLERARSGAYIPVCTRLVFLKFYTRESAQQVHFWGAQDRADYLDDMTRLLCPYFKQEKSTP
jgi:hypothetical protein